MDEDFLLIVKMKHGHENAADTFVKKYYADILKYCQFRIYHRNDAEDAVQETFCKFFKALPEYKHDNKLKHFLYRIAGNTCKDYYRRSVELSLEEDYVSEEDQGQYIENRIDVERALLQLQEEFYEVVILFYFQELKIREIAEILDIGVPLVKYRIKKAKELLGEMLGKEEGDHDFGRTITQV